MTTPTPTQKPILRIAYTRGRKLHAGRFEDDTKKVGWTLCGRFGYRHPRFSADTDVPLTLAFPLNGGCAHCLRELDKGER